MCTPKIALRAETGLLSMKHRIWGEKVNMFYSQKRSQDVLAKQVYQEQIEQDWLGLAQEVQEICIKIGIPDVNKNHTTKNSLKKALRNHDKEKMIRKMTTRSWIKSKWRILQKPQSTWRRSVCLTPD